MELFNREIKIMKDGLTEDKEYDSLKSLKIYIYGAGSFGREFYGSLRQHGVSVCGFLDKKADDIKELYGCSVLTPEALEHKETITVLIAIVMDKDERTKLIHCLKKLGYTDIQEAQYYRSLAVMPDDNDGKGLETYFINRKEKIEKAYSLMADEKSQRIFRSNLAAYTEGDYSACFGLEDNMFLQYFPQDINFSKGYGLFVDCGGYIGDTAEALKMMKPGDSDRIVIFEPDRNNYKKMQSRVENTGLKAICIPCAVGDKTEELSFSTAYGSGTLADFGEARVLCVAIDDVLHGMRPTFIKMDIEGAEIKALNGARRIIESEAPDLAICVYHAVNHIWDIPLLLHEWNKKYKFYLRSYNAYTMETVVYATT